ncbi:MAG: hypothetical protein Q8Q28_00200 [Pseudomonadota bacterium]|nr:hypothetical protein [Pseudomonadota bacterium]
MKSPKLIEKPAVIPAQVGIQFVGLIALNNNRMNNLASRLRGNDGISLAYDFA